MMESVSDIAYSTFSCKAAIRRVAAACHYAMTDCPQIGMHAQYRTKLSNKQPPAPNVNTHYLFLNLQHLLPVLSHLGFKEGAGKK